MNFGYYLCRKCSNRAIRTRLRWKVRDWCISKKNSIIITVNRWKLVYAQKQEWKQEKREIKTITKEIERKRRLKRKSQNIPRNWPYSYDMGFIFKDYKIYRVRKVKS